MSREAPGWLAELQARFGDVIRTPLDRSSGTLRAVPAAYDARVVERVSDAANASGVDRLAVYNRQYWFRLFEVVQRAFPLTARLVGYWELNDYASRFLLEAPPRGWDLDRVPDGFETFFEEALVADDEEARAWKGAARIDAAWRLVARAPETSPFRPSAADAARLLEARLVPSPAVVLVEEHFPLLALRAEIVGDPRETRVKVPPALANPRTWALAREDAGVRQWLLEPREAELLALLREHPVGDALGRLEHRCSAEERALLPDRTRTWLAHGVERGFWTGLELP